ncbi:SAM-dependent methyltransferase [Rasiella rasia]|uniref:SAM-dependent methyltransferase n=1 Tax=Rasiella rasia TaxID=2744027 RepID=A0A6G6GNW3_9FLAO|nr:methyltransferase [Rasiella rasia]QIE60113.1 SAM-dependent methyltransferase [Rasiella rasia]
MKQKSIKAIDALEEAQRIALAPFVFQTAVSLRKLGVFNYIFDNRDSNGVSFNEISESLSIPPYGLGVLLEMAESAALVKKNEDERYELTKTGYFLNYDKTVNVNLNFTHDVCYKGLFHLQDAITNGKPEGLQELGAWSTIYEGLSQLSPQVQQSWFEFDHHYSDTIFAEALQQVYARKPKHIFDIGGNTGKFALQCLSNSEDIHITIYDLPGQLKKALANVQKAGFGARVSGTEIDWLAPNPKIAEGADLIWMSQFLDCFSEAEIVTILKTCVASMTQDTHLLITETFTDRQHFDKAKYVLEATSIYFTVMANGNSKMYPATVFERLIDEAGLKIEEDLKLGAYHTMLVCKKK